MSTTAKVFVVLLVLLSVVFAIMNVTFVALSTDWKKQAQGWRDQAQAARVESMAVQASSKATEQQLQSQITQLTGQVTQLQNSVAKLETDLAGKNREIATEKDARAAAEANSERMSQLQKLDKERTTRLEDRNKKLQDDMIKLQKVNQDLDERCKELTMKLAIRDEEKRALLEQRYALQQQLEKIQKAPRAAGASSAPVAQPLSAAPSTSIRGQVLEVKGNVASISIGSADGVSEGMSFIVYRGKDYLGKLRVTMVEPNRAGGDLAMVRGEIRPQDRVADERSFGAE